MAVSLSISVKQNSQETEYNRTYVTVKVNLSWTYGSWNHEIPSPPGWVIINGTKHEFTSRFNMDNTTTGSQTLFTWAGNIPHNDDGTKTLVCSASFEPRINSTGTVTASSSTKLTDIPRASQPSLVTWPETTNDVGDFGDTISIHMNRKSDAFTHTVRYAFGTRSGTIATGVTTGTTWTIPLDFMNLMPATTTGSGLIYVDTYNGDTLIGTKYTGFTATVPASVKPTCNCTLTDITTAGTLYGAPVKGLSKIKVDVAATPAYSSPITSIVIEANGARYSDSSSITTGVLTKSGTSPVLVTVTDKRGRSGTFSYNMNVLDYNAPAVTALSVLRCNADGTANDKGEYIKVTFSASVSSMSSKNTATYKLRYKKSTATSYTTVTLTALANNFAPTNYSPAVIAASADSAYDIAVDVTDRHGTGTRSTAASTAFTLMNFHSSGTGIGVGKVAEKENTMQIALDVEFLGKVTGAIFDAILPVGSMVLRYDHTNPGTLYPGTTWVRVENAFPWFTAANGTIGQTGGERTVTLTASQIPSHNHGGTYTNAGTARTHAWLTSNGSAMGYETINSGGGEAHNNMPPYIQVSAWRRTA